MGYLSLGSHAETCEKKGVVMNIKNCVCAVAFLLVVITPLRINAYCWKYEGDNGTFFGSSQTPPDWLKNCISAMYDYFGIAKEEDAYGFCLPAITGSVEGYPFTYNIYGQNDTKISIEVSVVGYNGKSIVIDNIKKYDDLSLGDNVDTGGKIGYWKKKEIGYTQSSHIAIRNRFTILVAPVIEENEVENCDIFDVIYIQKVYHGKSDDANFVSLPGGSKLLCSLICKS